MNEYQRQSYLTSMGIENYMPRWRLVGAPDPIECLLPALPEVSLLSAADVLDPHSQDAAPLNVENSPVDKPVVVAEMLRDLQLEQPKRVMPRGAESKVVASVSAGDRQTIAAFALSIWRPHNELLILDSRNTQLALPTERLLQNILQAFYGAPQQLGNEEVLRWPLIDNNFVSRTVDDARGVLQVWLEVELERRPVKQLLLMGENAARYFLEADSLYSEVLFKTVELTQGATQALIAPSLVELLQQPVHKRSLWQALQPWRNNVNQV